MLDVYEISSRFHAIKDIGLSGMCRVCFHSAREMSYVEWHIVSLDLSCYIADNPLAIQLALQFVSANQTKFPPLDFLLRPKIVGGHGIKINDVPFMLALHIKNDGFTCGAVILSNRWGMSALHCIKPGTTAKHYFVRAGSSVNTAGGSVHKVAKFYTFDSKYYDGTGVPIHDIVIFRVRKPFRFSRKVRPAKLPLDGIVPPKLLRISGWGSSDVSIENSSSSVYLQAANVTQVKWSDCFAATAWYELLVSKKRHLCYGEENADACYGDSGGPLADSRTVYGIVSFGDGCGVSPGIYTKVLFYRQWIKGVTKV